MRILIIYDSIYGNTEKIVKGMTEVLNENHNVDIFRATQTVPSISLYDVVVIGSPTLSFAPTKSIKTKIKSMVSQASDQKRFYIFDTRVDANKKENKVFSFLPHKKGYALDDMVKWLGEQLQIEKQSFYVKETEGPLVAGEVERAKEWVEVL